MEAKKIIKSRSKLTKGLNLPRIEKVEKEGGCGITGIICSIPVSGRHIFEPSIQIPKGKNR